MHLIKGRNQTKQNKTMNIWLIRCTSFLSSIGAILCWSFNTSFSGTSFFSAIVWTPTRIALLFVYWLRLTYFRFYKSVKELRFIWYLLIRVTKGGKKQFAYLFLLAVLQKKIQRQQKMRRTAIMRSSSWF